MGKIPNERYGSYYIGGLVIGAMQNQPTSGGYLSDRYTPLSSEGLMQCNPCRSEHQLTCPAEVSIHFPGLENLTKPTVMVFPSLQVCSDCGTTQFVIPHVELRELVEGYHTVTQAHSEPSTIQSSP
jgi:hypothetical protein